MGISIIVAKEPPIKEPDARPISEVNQISAEAKFISVDFTLSPIKAAVGAVLMPQATPYIAIKIAIMMILEIKGIEKRAKKAKEYPNIKGACLPILSDKVPIGILTNAFGKPLMAKSMLIVVVVNHRVSFAYIGKSVPKKPVATK